MELMTTLFGHAARLRDFPVIDPGANIEVGAGLIAGTTVNKSGLRLGTAAWPDFAGIAAEQFLDAAGGTVAAGTLELRKVLFEPTAFYLAEVSQVTADLLSNDVASATTTAVTFATAQADDFDGGWIYCATGGGLGQLRYIGAATTTVFTVGTGMAYGTALTTTSDVIMVVPAGTQVLDFEATARRVVGQNGSGGADTGRAMVIANWIESDSIPRTQLNPTAHGTLNGLDANTKLKFWHEIVFTDTFLHKID